jgi:hypothetical protein
MFDYITMDVDKDFVPVHRTDVFRALMTGAHVETAVVKSGV